MAAQFKKGNVNLGIDINDEEIRVVEIQGSWPSPKILRAAYIATPKGAVINDEIVRPELVAKALTALLSSMGTSTRTAVMGIAAGLVATRVLDVPSVPPEEMRSIIRGEIVHQRILPNSNGEFDYVALASGDGRVPARPRLLVMAAERRFVASYASAASMAGIELLALEPRLTALYRALSPLAYKSSPCLCLMVGPTVSELAIIDSGVIRLYRRMDSDTREVLAAIAAVPQAAERSLASAEESSDLTGDYSVTQPDLLRDSASNEYDPRPLASEAADTPASRNLLMEIRRSIDFYQRECPQAPSVANIVVVSSTQELSPFAAWLSNAVHTTAVAATALSFATASASDDSLRQRLHGADSVRFMGAIGLAMRGLDELPEEIPQFNLLKRDANDTRQTRSRINVGAVMAVCTAIVFATFLNVARLNNKLAAANGEFDRVTVEAHRLKTYRGMPFEEARIQASILGVVRVPGAPLPQVMDAVARSLPPKAALSDISTDEAGGITVTGIAAADTDLLMFLDGLRQKPEFDRVSLDRLDRDSASPTSQQVRYTVAVKLR